MGPMISKAIGKKRCTRDNSVYLLSLRVAAASAADAARTDDVARYEAATVFVTVTSQVALRPSCHRIEVKPSGRFPSDLVNPFGSLTEGIPALVIARQTRSFMK